MTINSFIKHHLLFVRDRKSTRLNSSHVAISYAILLCHLHSCPTRRSSDLTTHESPITLIASISNYEDFHIISMSTVCSFFFSFLPFNQSLISSLSLSSK